MIFLETQTLILAANLELLENAFYTKGLAQFSEADFAAANFSALVRQRYQEIQGHEQVHVELLSSILGSDAPKPCQYNLYVFFCGMGF
jgi:Ferritin-like domain